MNEPKAKVKLIKKTKMFVDNIQENIERIWT